MNVTRSVLLSLRDPPAFKHRGGIGDGMRIDTRDSEGRWRLKCPECRSTNWRAHNGTFGCRRCHATVTELYDAEERRLVSRDEIEFVGPEASHKGVEAYPPDGWPK